MIGKRGLSGIYWVVAFFFAQSSFASICERARCDRVFSEASRTHFSKTKNLTPEERSHLEAELTHEENLLRDSLNLKVSAPGESYSIRSPILTFKFAKLLLDASTEGFYGCHEKEGELLCLYPAVRFVYDVVTRSEGSVRQKRLTRVKTSSAQFRCLQPTIVRTKNVWVRQPTLKKTVRTERKTGEYQVPERSSFEVVRKRVEEKSLISKLKIPQSSLESTAVIMDTSGSMMGAPLSALKLTFIDLMDKIKIGRRLDLYFFEHGRILRFVKGVDNPVEIVQAVFNAKAYGGSSIGEELMSAYADAEIQEIFVITDGGLTDQDYATAQVDAEWIDRIKSTHLICIDCKLVGKRPEFAVTAAYLRNENVSPETLIQFIEREKATTIVTANREWRKEFSLKKDEWIPENADGVSGASRRGKVGLIMGFLIYDHTMATTRNFSLVDSKDFKQKELDGLGRRYLNALSP